MFNFFDKLKSTVSKTAQALIGNVTDAVSSEEEFIRDFQIENDIYLDPEEQIEYEEKQEYTEMEW